MPDIYESLRSLAMVDREFAKEIDPDGFWQISREDDLKGLFRDPIQAAIEKVVDSMNAVHSTKAKAAAVIRAMISHFSFYDGEHDIVDVSDLLRVADRLEGRRS